MPKKKKNVLTSLFEDAEKAAEKATGMSFFSLSEFEKEFGVPGYIGTQLWDLDLMLMHDKERAHYGIPRGRLTEIHGQESSFKTTLCHRLAAETIAQGGRVYWLSTELDFDREYALSNIREFGVDEEVAEENFRPRPVRTIGEMFNACKALMSSIEDSAEKLKKQGKDVLKEMPPILFVVDSIASFLSDADYKRLDKDWDEGLQVGARAGELHRFFQFFLYAMARVGAAMVITNHYRANLGYGQRKWNPAHDNPIKYYASLRMAVKAWNWSPLSRNKNPTRSGVEYTYGRAINCSVYKVRGDWVVDGETELRYQFHHGFDYYHSAINTLLKTGTAELDGKEFVIDEPEDSELAALNGYYNLKEITTKLAEAPEKLPEYMYWAMKKGPISLEDLRS